MKSANLLAGSQLWNEGATNIVVTEFAPNVWSHQGMSSYNVPPIGSPSEIRGTTEPLSQGAIRIVDSILNARVPEAAILRDLEEGF